MTSDELARGEALLEEFIACGKKVEASHTNRNFDAWLDARYAYDRWALEHGPDLFAAAEECETLKQQMQWQPIETAPKDGRDVFIWNDGPYIARWTNPDGMFGWWDDSGEVGLQHHPTHWMPLPAPPAVQTETR